MFLEISQNSQENTCVRVFFLNNVWGLQACNFVKKETLAQGFSRKFYEISKNTFFAEHLWATASRLNIHIKIIQYWSGVTYCTKVYINLCHAIFQYLFALLSYLLKYLVQLVLKVIPLQIYHFADWSFFLWNLKINICA